MSNETMTLKVIAHIHTAFPTKFGIPRQSGLVDELEAGSFFCEQYGVKIAEEDGDCAQIRGITTSAVRIDELMTTLVEQQVSPTVLEDVVQDWL